MDCRLCPGIPADRCRPQRWLLGPPSPSPEKGEEAAGAQAQRGGRASFPRQAAGGRFLARSTSRATRCARRSLRLPSFPCGEPPGPSRPRLRIRRPPLGAAAKGRAALPSPSLPRAPHLHCTARLLARRAATRCAHLPGSPRPAPCSLAASCDGRGLKAPKWRSRDQGSASRSGHRAKAGSPERAELGAGCRPPASALRRRVLRWPGGHQAMLWRSRSEPGLRKKRGWAAPVWRGWGNGRWLAVPSLASSELRKSPGHKRGGARSALWPRHAVRSAFFLRSHRPNNTSGDPFCPSTEYLRDAQIPTPSGGGGLSSCLESQRWMIKSRQCPFILASGFPSICYPPGYTGT